MSEETRIDLPDEVRLAKVHAMRARGMNPFPNGFRPSSSLGEIAGPLRAWKQGFSETEAERWVAERDAYNSRPAEERQVAVAGRVMARRDFGKGIFLELQDRSGRLQVLLGKQTLPEAPEPEQGQSFEFFKKELDVGDFIGAEGALFWTRTGELTVQASTARLLSKSLRPLPEKWHGLQDVETRYRQRYVDLIVNEEVREVFRKRTATVKAIRSFLDERGFLEVETPMLHPLAGGATAKPFVTHHNALDMELYLRIAPELFLKRLVVGGFEKVYEINRNFRNEGLSRRHNPEFTMLEFYWAYATYLELMELTEELVEFVTREVTGGTTVRYDGKPINMARPWRRMTMRQAIVEVAGLSEADLDDVGAMRAHLARTQIPLKGDEPRGKLMTLLFEELVEPKLWEPTFVTDFPVEVSPLARRSDSDPSVTERFELYVAGREIANAFSELNDPEDQRERFLAQMAAKEAGDEEAAPYDADYIRALQYGLPPTAGEGIGIDRLVMLLVDAPSIRDVILFPHMRPESG